MPLKRTFAKVLLDNPEGDPLVLDAEVRVVDQSRAEERGLSASKQNQRTGFFWAWSALKRTGQTELTFDEFLKAAISVDLDTKDYVDPTSQAASDDSA